MLDEADGMARCYNCDTVFNAYDNQVTPPDLTPAADEPGDAGRRPLPFDVPDNLSELEIADHAVIDPEAVLNPRRRRLKARHWLMLLLLLAGLTVQFAWLQRDWLLLQPIASPLCQWLECPQQSRFDAKAFRIIERELSIPDDQPDVLALWLRFRNASTIHHPWPEVSLTVLDSNANAVASRSLKPSEYLPGTVNWQRSMKPQEVVTISLMFEDPGHNASGFEIDFAEVAQPAN